MAELHTHAGALRSVSTIIGLQSLTAGQTSTVSLSRASTDVLFDAGFFVAYDRSSNRTQLAKYWEAERHKAVQIRLAYDTAIENEYTKTFQKCSMAPNAEHTEEDMHKKTNKKRQKVQKDDMTTVQKTNSLVLTFVDNIRAASFSLVSDLLGGNKTHSSNIRK